MNSNYVIMRKFILIVSILFFQLFSIGLFAQRIITGNVKDGSTQRPIEGVSVMVNSTNDATITDASGGFAIEVPNEKSTITFSVIGYKSLMYTVSDEKSINVTLETTFQSLEQVVVIGYGTEKEKDLTGAVSTINTESLQSRPIINVANGLQGLAPGLTVTSTTGALGESPKITLRGAMGSINTGSDGAKPLILLDNVEIQDLQAINPEDIESITVLKDAASASIYGTRGAFGVILISTKSGKKNAKSRISYSNNFSWATPTVTPQKMDAINQVITSLNAVQRLSPNQNSYLLIGVTVDASSIDKTKEWVNQYGNQKLSNEMVMGRDFEIRNGNLYFYRPWDDQEIFFKKWTPQQSHNLSISGGNETTSYYLGLGLINEDGVLKANSDRFGRKNLTFGINSNVNKWFEVRSKIFFSRTNTKTPFVFQSEQFNPLYYFYRWTTTYPYGTFEGEPFRSAFTEINQAKLNEDINTIARVSVGGTLKPFKGLTVDFDYTFSSINDHLHKTGGSVSAYDFWSFNGRELEYKKYTNSIYNYVSYFSSWNSVNTGRAFATYNRKFNDHAFKVMVGSDIEMFKFNSQNSQRNGLLDPNRGEISLATGNQFVDGSAIHWSTLGFFGRANYAYKQNYLLEINGRFDGSSQFPIGHFWAFFPSVSAGYILSNNPIMKFSDKVLNFLKLRVSYGSVGNQAVGGNRFLAIMNSRSSSWLLPGFIAPTMGNPQAVSPTLSWEKIGTLNLGLDARFLDDMFILSFDWFQRNTRDMISPGGSLPASFGAAAPLRNYGELTGRGFELSLGFNHVFPSGLGINIRGNLADSRERVTKFFNTTRILPNQISQVNNNYYEGMYIGEIWGYVTDGLFQSNDFSGKDNNGKYVYAAGVPSQSKLESGSFVFGPGDVKYKDINGDGIIYNGTNTVDDPGDMKIIGNSTPRLVYGINFGIDWKGFDFGLFLQGVGKRQLWGASKFVLPGTDNSLFGAAWFDYQLDYWSENNINAFYPRPTNNAQNWNFLPQTRYLLNMAYLRVKNLTVGYTIPSSAIKTVGLKSARVYFSGENILTFDHLNDIALDPETDYTKAQINTNAFSGFGAIYPYRLNVSVGLQISF